MPVRRIQEKRGWAIGFAAALIKPSVIAATSRTWIDGTKIPATGGCIVALNHISHLDPLLSAYFLYDHGRIPRYLAKAELFTNPILKRLLIGAGQIPVTRLSRDAVGAYDAAVREVNDGQCVVVYPEGTLTRDPDLWPMAGKTGAARIALATGCPVIPVGHWGAQDILYPYSARPDLFPRKSIVMKAGDPVLLDDLLDQPTSAATTREATDRIMRAVTGLVEDVRGETAPTDRFDPRKAGVTEIGNPDKAKPRKRRRR